MNAYFLNYKKTSFLQNKGRLSNFEDRREMQNLIPVRIINRELDSNEDIGKEMLDRHICIIALIVPYHLARCAMYGELPH